MRLPRCPLLALLLLAVALSCGSSGGSHDGGTGGRTGAAGTGGGTGASGGESASGSGSGGRDGGAGKDGAADAGVPDVTWKENGVLRTATYPSLVTRHTTAASDTLNFVAADIPAGATVSFAISGQALLDGTYACGADGGSVVAVSYNNVVTTDQSCSVTVTFTVDAAGNPRASGTFEAVVMIPAGMKTLTEGQFDFAVMAI